MGDELSGKVAVWCLTHDTYTHSKSGVQFEPYKRPTPDGNGRALYGRAVVDAEVAAKHFHQHPSFEVEWSPEQAEALAARAADAADAADAAASESDTPKRSKRRRAGAEE